MIESLGRITKGKNRTANVQNRLRNSKVLLNLTYRCETRTWNRVDSSRNQAIEMSSFRGACSATRWDGVGNAERYRCGMSERGKDIGFGVTEMV